MRKVCITGVTGKTGAWFLRELEAHAAELEDWEFTFVSRSAGRSAAIAPEGIRYTVRTGDIRSADFLRELFAPGAFDTLLHIAGTRRSAPVVRYALESGVRRMILVHTTGIWSRFKAASEEYKQAEEEIARMCEGKDVSVTILRPTMIYGTENDHNISEFMKMLRKSHVVPLIGGGKSKVQPVWCGDLGRAYFQVLTTPSANVEEYVLSGGTVMTVSEMLHVLQKKLGTRNVFVPVPFGLAYAGACCLYALTGHKKDLREKVQRMTEDRAWPHDAAAHDFGYDPLPFDKGTDRMLEEIRKTK